MLFRMNPYFGSCRFSALLLAHVWLNALLLNLHPMGTPNAAYRNGAALDRSADGRFLSSGTSRLSSCAGRSQDRFFSVVGTEPNMAHVDFTFLFHGHDVIAVAAKIGTRPVPRSFWCRSLPGPFALIWFAILSHAFLGIIVSRDRWMDHSTRKRRGLALLLEMARSWPRNRSRPIEPVFVAAGGQRLDYAGSREVVRLLKSEWPAKPSLLLLFFAPAPAQNIASFRSYLFMGGLQNSPCPIHHFSLSRMDELVEMWRKASGFRFRLTDPWSHLLFWPFERKLMAAEVAVVVLTAPTLSHSRTPRSIPRS